MKRIYVVTPGETLDPAEQGGSLSDRGRRQVDALRSSLPHSISMVCVTSGVACFETIAALGLMTDLDMRTSDVWCGEPAKIKEMIRDLPDRTVLCAEIECIVALGKSRDDYVDAALYLVTVHKRDEDDLDESGYKDGMIECFLNARGRISEPPAATHTPSEAPASV